MTKEIEKDPGKYIRDFLDQGYIDKHGAINSLSYALISIDGHVSAMGALAKQ